MYISLNDAKRHLYVEHNEDDLLITDIITVAEDAVRRDLNIDALSELEDNAGMIPASVVQAILLLVGTLYANRESVTYGKPEKVPHTYDFLIDLNRKYYKEEEETE